MLQILDLHTYYGKSHIVKGLSLEIVEGEVITLIGRNGAGKSTTLKSVIGLVPPRQGRVRFRDEDITGQKPFEIARRGIGYVPEERRIFSNLTVLENLDLAARADAPWSSATALDRFPSLARRRDHKGRELSGGEQQMLAIARALVGGPRLLMLDEPSQGLAPVVVESVMHVIDGLRAEGLSILLVEQNIHVATALATRHYVIDQGRIVFAGTTAELRANSEVWERHFALGLAGR